MLVYNTTFNISGESEQEWTNWLKTWYIPRVEESNLTFSSRFLRLLTEIDNGGATFTFQCDFENLIYLELFQVEIEQPAIKELNRRFAGNYVCFTTLLEDC